MVMLDSGASARQTVAAPIVELPAVGPDFATIGNPAYVALLQSYAGLYRASHPEDTRFPGAILAAIDGVVLDALVDRKRQVTDTPQAAGHLALGALIRPQYS